jgi:hypothetical protein
MSANVYIDGFNLYYGSLKKSLSNSGATYKWLDVSKLASVLFPRKQIKRIRYFSANVKAFNHDKDAPIRQEVYFRALSTIPNLTIHKGRYALREICLPQYPLAYVKNNQNKPPQNVQVLKSEEKRSDVNLATYLLTDCFSGDMDEAIVISNDSDLCLPIEMVVNQCGKPVHLVNPQNRDVLSWELRKVASTVMSEINKKCLANSQFPPTLTDAKGTFQKPSLW